MSVLGYDTVAGKGSTWSGVIFLTLIYSLASTLVGLLARQLLWTIGLPEFHNPLTMNMFFILCAAYGVQYFFYHGVLFSFFGGTISGGLIIFYNKDKLYHDVNSVKCEAFSDQYGDWLNYIRPRVYLKVQLCLRSSGTLQGNGVHYVTVINTHPNALPSNESNIHRVNQMKQVVKECESSENVIVCGDMNISSPSEEIDVLQDAGLADTWNTNSTPGYTWSSQNPRCKSWLHSDDCRIDYIMSRGLKCLKSKVVLDDIIKGRYHDSCH